MKRRAFLILLCALALVVGPSAQTGTITLTTPTAQTSIASYTPVTLTLTRGSSASIIIVLADNRGVQSSFTYPNAGVVAYDTAAEVDGLITALNTANLSTAYVGTFSAGSLWQRIFFRLCTDFPSRFPGGCTVS